MSPDRISPTGASRLASLDAARGLIVVLMAIDHARAFIARNHPSEFWGTPLPDYQGDWLAFMTRLVTHLCAPGFMFLMGAGAALFAASRALTGWSPVRIAGQLALRGLVLIVVGQLLENTAANFGSAGASRSVNYGLRVPGAPGDISVILRRALRARFGAGCRGAARQAAALGARADVGSLRRPRRIGSRPAPPSSAIRFIPSSASSSCRASPVP